MLHELDLTAFKSVLPLFQPYLQDPMMHAVIEGRSGGRVFVDDASSPAAAFVWTGTECAYIAGGDQSARFLRALRQLVVEEVIPAAQAGGREYLSLFSFPESYAPTLEDLFSDQAPLRTPLSTFTFDEAAFDGRHAPQNQLPGAGLALRQIGAGELEAPQNAYLAQEIKAYWGTVECFLDEGSGYCVLDGDNLASWCYVQAYGHGSQTIDIWTAPSHRRRGLGTLVAAAVIRASLAEGYTPFWICDKANTPSRRLAERLGFLYSGDIPLVDIPFEPYSFYRGLAEHFFLPQGEHRQAAEAYDRAFSVRQAEAEDCYQAAVAWALAGEAARALEYIQAAIEKGWNDLGAAEGEQAFAALRMTAEWKDLKALGGRLQWPVRDE